jgi:hypothetical protein
LVAAGKACNNKPDEGFDKVAELVEASSATAASSKQHYRKTQTKHFD